MFYPIFVYLQLVMIHTPTPAMVFYKCGNVGRVSEFHSCTDNYKAVCYRVKFKCATDTGSLYVDYIKEENLRSVK